MGQAAAPLAMQQQQIAHEVNMMKQTYATAGIRQADSAIKNAYKYLNTDPTFRSNKTIQERVRQTLEGYRASAIQRAQAGDLGPIYELAQLGETQMRGVLGYLKATEGVPSAGVGPLPVGGATVETARSAVSGEDIVLTAEQQEIARRMGPGGEEKLKQGLRDLQKYNDLEFSE